MSEIQFLRGYLSIYSPTGQERPAAELLVRKFREWGWRAEIDAAGNAVGECGGGERLLCFLGHIDTVPGEIDVREENGLLYGRGAVDAKGTLAAFACALARCSSKLNNLKVRIIGATEEECSTSKGTRYAVEKYARPDFLIIGEPSHWQRLTLGYKGIFHFEYRLSQPRAHGAAEEASAATKAVRLWNHLFEKFPPDAAKPDSPFHNLTGNIRSFETTNDGEREGVRMAVDLRLPPTLAPGRVEAAIAAFTAAEKKSAEADFTIHEALPAVRCAKNTELVRAFLAAIRALGGEPGFNVKTGTSDMNIAQPVWQCPTLAYGPGNSRLDHTPDEHIEVDEYLKSIDVYEHVLLRLNEQ